MNRLFICKIIILNIFVGQLNHLQISVCETVAYSEEHSKTSLSFDL